MIDAHCHLFSNKYDEDLEVVIRRAKKRLSAVVTSAVDHDSLKKSLALRQQHPDFIYVTAGIHPRKTSELSDEKLHQFWVAIEKIRSDIVAVGEIGPDFHHTRNKKQRHRQLQLLEQALAFAETWRLPLVVHARRAEAHALEILSSSRVPVMFHCFTGSEEVARKISAKGFFISFSAATKIPVELILTETDSPALSPQPGQTRNEPVFVEKVVSCLAGLMKCPPEKIAEMTETNARKFFRLPQPQNKS
jgi:TatD DNase family protein